MCSLFYNADLYFRTNMPVFQTIKFSNDSLRLVDEPKTVKWSNKNFTILGESTPQSSRNIIVF